MKYSKLFGKTVREAPKDATLISHKLLYKGGFIRELSSGRYMLTPLGFRVQQNIMNIIDEEMEKTGSQRLIVPIFHPLELWQATHRDEVWGENLSQVQDRRGAKFAVGATAEAVMVDFVKKFHPSWRDLPIVIHQFSNKFRDELRARGGLLRTREFTMKDAYSFAPDEDSFMKTYWDQYHAYEEIAKRLDLEVIPVEADSGALGGDFCHEFMVPCELGEDSIITCECGYSANTEKAVFDKENKNLEEDENQLVEVDAVRGTTMDDGVKLHNLPLWQQIKDVMYKDSKGRYILVIIRGDFDVNEVKLSKILGVSEFEMASDEDIRKDLNSEPGFISPVGIKQKMKSGVELIIVGDDSLRTIKNAYGGANAKNKDLKNVNIDRDYKADIEGDIALAKEGYTCAKCKKNQFKTRKTIEFGHVFKYDDFYTKAMGCTFTDKDGKEKHLQMGAYGIGVERAMAIVVETHFDDKGIIWPESIAPYKYHLITLKSKESDDKINEVASEIYEKLGENSVLWDERVELSAGEKFSDADLIGCPIRIVVSDKSLLNGGVEVKKRVSKNSEILNIDKDYINKLVNY